MAESYMDAPCHGVYGTLMGVRMRMQPSLPGELDLIESQFPCRLLT